MIILTYYKNKIVFEFSKIKKKIEQDLQDKISSKIEKEKQT